MKITQWQTNPKVYSVDDHLVTVSNNGKTDTFHCTCNTLITWMADSALRLNREPCKHITGVMLHRREEGHGAQHAT